MAVNTFSNFSTDSQTYIASQLLMRIHRDVIVYPMARHEKLPNRFSTTFQFTRFEKLPLPNTVLTEGVTPANGETMTISTVQATMNQWGDYVTLTDVAVITVKHPALEQAVILLSEQARELIDRECINLLLTNANVQYPGVSSRASLTATTYITSGVIKLSIAALRRGGAHPLIGRLYQGLMDPSVEMDLLGESTFVTAASYSNIFALMNGEAGTWMGVRWVVSNIIPVLYNISAVTTGSTTGGSLANSTTYDLQVVQRDAALGFVSGTTLVQTQATGGSGTAITIALPNTPNALFDIYFGASSTTMYLVSSLNAGNQTITVLAVPSSSSGPVAPPASGVNVHFSWIFGKEAFAAPELMSLETFITPAVASDSDPLVQRRKVAWKFMFKPVICNDTYIERIECASAYDVTLQ
jgi:N4-gp56 family major capsid protein